VGQFTPDLQDQILQGGIGAAGPVRRVRVVGPIDAIQALPFGPLDPGGHRGTPDAEGVGHGTQRLATADSAHPGPATRGLTLCLLMELPPDGSDLGEL